MKPKKLRPRFVVFPSGIITPAGRNEPGAMSAKEAAKRTGRPVKEVMGIWNNGPGRLFRAIRRAQAPFIPADNIVTAAHLLKLPPAKLLAVYWSTRATANSDPISDSTIPHIEQARVEAMAALSDAIIDAWCQGEVRI